MIKYTKIYIMQNRLYFYIRGAVACLFDNLCSRGVRPCNHIYIYKTYGTIYKAFGTIYTAFGTIYTAFGTIYRAF